MRLGCILVLIEVLCASLTRLQGAQKKSSLIEITFRTIQMRLSCVLVLINWIFICIHTRLESAQT